MNLGNFLKEDIGLFFGVIHIILIVILWILRHPNRYNVALSRLTYLFVLMVFRFELKQSVEIL